jgi:hypothetical protein
VRTPEPRKTGLSNEDAPERLVRLAVQKEGYAQERSRSYAIRMLDPAC